MDTTSYGLHLILDAYGAPEEALSDMGRLYRILSELPALIGMRRVSTPQILKVDEEGIAGLSGFVFIMESHISIHTYAERGFVTADVYSCKEFDAGKAVGYLRDELGFTSEEVSVVERGKRFHEKGGR